MREGDVYLNDSLKLSARTNRATRTLKRIFSSAKIPENWKDILRNGDNKDELFQFLGRTNSSCQIRHELLFQVGDGENSKTVDTGGVVPTGFEKTRSNSGEHSELAPIADTHRSMSLFTLSHQMTNGLLFSSCIHRLRRKGVLHQPWGKSAWKTWLTQACLTRNHRLLCYPVIAVHIKHTSHSETGSIPCCQTVPIHQKHRYRQLNVGPKGMRTKNMVILADIFEFNMAAIGGGGAR